MAPMSSMRLDNALQQHGVCARKDVRKLCRLVDVEVHHDERRRERLIKAGTKVDPRRVTVDGKPLAYAGVQLHLVMHKPVGVVCSHAEDEGETVYGLLPPKFLVRSPALSTIGRLDRMASGLLLLTQSGILNNRLTHPRRACSKEYVVSLRDALSKTGIEAAAFASGRLVLADGGVCRPAQVVPHATHPNICRVTLHEGRYHQIRRMFAAVGHEVTGIHRSAFGGLQLSALGLKPGEWRLLKEEELRTLLANSEEKEEWAPSVAAAAGIERVKLRRLDDGGAGGAAAAGGADEAYYGTEESAAGGSSRGTYSADGRTFIDTDGKRYAVVSDAEIQRTNNTRGGGGGKRKSRPALARGLSRGRLKR